MQRRTMLALAASSVLAVSAAGLHAQTAPGAGCLAGPAACESPSLPTPRVLAPTAPAYASTAGESDDSAAGRLLARPGWGTLVGTVAGVVVGTLNAKAYCDLESDCASEMTPYGIALNTTLIGAALGYAVDLARLHLGPRSAAGQPAAPLQSAASTARPQVLILGTYHLAGSTDYTAVEPDDILSEQRQREVEEVVRRLERFRPTHIAVEVPAERDSALHARYQRYLAGAHALSRSETEQIGFRLARRLGHPKLHAIDYKLDEDVGRVVRWAAEHGDTGFVRLVERFAARMAASQDSIRSLPLVEALRRHNTPEYDALHSAYLRMARVGAGDDHVGAEVVAGRYERNLKIFANLARLARPGDRILVIYGASHGKLLRDFVDESAELELVDVRPYLAAAPAEAR